jgi:transposase
MWYALGMTAPIFVRPPTTDELAALQAAVRGNDAFAVRRAQIILASAARQTASQTALAWHCSSEAVREAIHAFNHFGLACLHKGSNRALSQKPQLDESKSAALRAMLHQSPREFGLPHSLWSLARLAIVCQQQGLTREVVSIETVRQALLRLGLKWRQARRHITSPDPNYERKKNGGTS